MLVGRRHLTLRRRGIVFSEAGIVHSRYRINVKERRGGVIDDDALDKTTLRSLEENRSILVLQLDGESLWRRQGHSQLLREGEFIVTHRNSGLNCRLAGSLRTLLIEWEPGLLGTRLTEDSSPSSISRDTLLRVRQEVGVISREDCDATRGSQAAARLLWILREEGLPFDPIDAGSLREKVPASFAALFPALDQTLSLTEEMPSVSDLEARLGWPRNRIHQVLCRFQKHYAFHAVGGWRNLRQVWLLSTAASLMSVPGMTTEEAAATLGYATPRALCYAFANAGMPSPGNIRHAFSQLA